MQLRKAALASESTHPIASHARTLTTHPSQKSDGNGSRHDDGTWVAAHGGSGGRAGRAAARAK